MSQVDPEKDSEFARSRALAAEKGTAPGVDPETGERAAITYRQLFNETGGDEARAKQIFRDVARAGGYGDVDFNQALDVRGLSRSIKENEQRADKAEDLFERKQHEQQAQHQVNLVDDVGRALDQLKKG